MRRRPRDPQARIFDRATIVSALIQGFWSLVVTLGAFLISLYRGQGEMDARSISFTTLVLGNLALIWANRSRTRTIPEMFHSRNLPVFAVTLFAMLLLAVCLYVPYVRNVFQFSVLHLDDIAIAVTFALLGVTWVEVQKLRRRNGRQMK